MEARTREVLELFVEKARLLDEGRFVKFVQDNGVALNVDVTVGKPNAVAVVAPDKEAVLALTVTFRQFIQDNDPISFGNIAKLTADPGLSENWKSQFNDVRSKLNCWLDRSSMIEIDGQRLIRRQIMDVFIYGHLAHNSKEKRATYQNWKSNPFLFQFIENEFKAAVLDVLNAIFHLAPITEAELEGIPILIEAEEVEIE